MFENFTIGTLAWIAIVVLFASFVPFIFKRIMEKIEIVNVRNGFTKDVQKDIDNNKVNQTTIDHYNFYRGQADYIHNLYNSASSKSLVEEIDKAGISLKEKSSSYKITGWEINRNVGKSKTKK